MPGDVSVVGFDDAPLAQSTHPPLTTVHQSPEQNGEVAWSTGIPLLVRDPSAYLSRRRS